MKTAYFRAFLILIIGTILCASITFVASAGGGRASGASVRQTASAGQVPAIKKRIGEIPAKAQTSPFLGYLAPNERIRMLLSFQLSDEAGLQQLISDLYNPDSPQYHQWLSPEQFGGRFGRANDEIDWVVKWLQQQGMDVDRTYTNRLSIGFTGTVDAVQQAFQVQIATYFDVANNKPFYSNTSAPTLPVEFEAFTVGLEGLSNAAVYHRPTRIAQAQTSAQARAYATSAQAKAYATGGYQPQGKVGSFLFLLPQDLALLYDYTPLWNANIKGAGQKVGIVIDSDVPNSDMTTYRTDAGLPAANLQRILYPGFSNPGLTAGEDEADLDTQNVSAVAPAAEIDLVLIPGLESVSIQTVEQDIINQNTIHVVSESFGICESEGFSSAEQTIFNQAVTQGTAFFASSGDEGVNCDETVLSLHGTECPACYGGVTSVGGTHLQANFDNQGNVTSRASEVVWNTPPGVRLNCTGGNSGGGAGGGGVCSTVSMPTYQTGSQGFTGGVPAGNKRVVPDVTAIADPGPIGPLLVINGSLFYGGGTSQSSPLLAGMMALINQFKGAAQGSPNTVLYRLGVNQYKNGGPHAFLDITSGNNNVAPISPCLPSGVTGFAAGTGYDAVSGWGAPDVSVIAHNFGGGSAPGMKHIADFDGDAKTDISIWRGTTGVWWVINSSTQQITSKGWGLPNQGDIPVPGDYDGDGKTDIAIYRGSTGDWWIINSHDGSVTHKSWGLPGVGDIPVPGDYDGDGKTDIAIYRASTGTWWIINSHDGSITTKGWGLPNVGDVPVPGDYDGDGKTDIGIWRGSTGDWWIIDSSTGNFTRTNLGLASAGDQAVVGDYDGDGKNDLAIWNGNTGMWHILRSSDGGTTTTTLGSASSGDVPSPGDYDGDGKTDVAVWRGSTGMWFIVNSSTGMTVTTSWGLPNKGDVPVPSTVR
jgi:hypothetical protein